VSLNEDRMMDNAQKHNIFIFDWLGLFGDAVSCWDYNVTERKVGVK
jgi:hypothetical protein